MDCSNIIAAIKPNMAFILVLKNGNVVSQGSGFVFLEKNILVTCDHVINEENGSIFIRFPDYPQDKWIQGKIAIQDKEHDLALLKFEDDSRIPLSKVDDGDIKEGIEVIIAGYPLNISSLTTHQGILSSITKDATGMVTYLIDGTVNPGNSGCPVLNKDGKVVAVVNATRREAATLISKVQEMNTGTISLNGIDLVEIHQALIRNLQLGIGYAVPCGYIPPHKEMNI